MESYFQIGRCWKLEVWSNLGQKVWTVWPGHSAGDCKPCAFMYAKGCDLAFGWRIAAVGGWVFRRLFFFKVIFFLGKNTITSKLLQIVAASVVFTILFHGFRMRQERYPMSILPLVWPLGKEKETEGAALVDLTQLVGRESHNERSCFCFFLPPWNSFIHLFHFWRVHNNGSIFVTNDLSQLEAKKIMYNGINGGAWMPFIKIISRLPGTGKKSIWTSWPVARNVARNVGL